MTTALTIQGDVTSPAGRYVIGPLSIANTLAVGEIHTIDLASGFNTVSVGDNSTGCILVPPSNNTSTIKIKGVTGDTGVLLSKTKPSVITLDSGVTNIGITAGGAIANVQFVWF